MPDLKLWTLSILLGLVFGLPHIYGVLKPARYGSALRKFPRYTPAGYLLVIAATLWFLASVLLRHLIDWQTANEQRIRLLSGLRFGFGILLIILGATVFRHAEQKSRNTRSEGEP